MKKPDFLIIGSMKAGTTSLYDDLATHPQIFLPELKEPDAFISDEILDPAVQNKYFRLFQDCPSGSITGEASTTYSKLPTLQDVPQRAAKILGTKLKLIYLVRDPLERIRSHHAYLYRRGYMGRDINEVLRTDRTPIDYSNYQMQLTAWLSIFPRDQILVIQFEKYISNRNEQLRAVYDFLGIDDTEISAVPKHVSNKTDDLVPLPAVFRRIRDTRLYRKIHEMLPGQQRSKLGWLRRRVRGRIPAPPISLDDSNIALLREELRGTTHEFAEEWGIDESLWNMIFTKA